MKHSRRDDYEFRVDLSFIVSITIAILIAIGMVKIVHFGNAYIEEKLPDVDLVEEFCGEDGQMDFDDYLHLLPNIASFIKQYGNILIGRES